MHLKRIICASAAALGVCAATTGTAFAASTLNEAGSTLIQPLASEWGTNFGIYTGNTVNVAGGGSSTGIADICAASPSVDIGATDAPIGPSGTACANLGSIVQIPWALSATGIVYNIHGVHTGLRLNDKVLAEIFEGKITKWNNPQIQALQKKVWYTKKHVKVHGHKRTKRIKHTKVLFHLPNLAIAPVVRSGGSGDTYAFTNYLKHGPSHAWSQIPTTTWANLTGVVGTQESGNSGVVNEVSATSGGIGYASVYYLISAVSSNPALGVGAIKNNAGNFLLPGEPQIAAAGAGVKSLPAQGQNFGVSIVDPPKSRPQAYPISTYTYAAVRKSGNPNAAALKQFLTYAVSAKFEGHTGGLDTGTGIGFAPLSSGLSKADLKLINGLS